MNIALKHPWVTAMIFGVIWLLVSCLIPIPLFDGFLAYNQELVHFKLESKIALSYFLNIGLSDQVKNGVYPSSIELKPVGWALLLIIHVGLPALIGLRLKVAKRK